MLSDFLSSFLTIIEIIIGLVSICGFLYGGFVWIIRPIRDLIKQTSENNKKIEKIINVLDEKVIPFMSSMTHEFSPNSGKSIKDQINRIDNATRLAELRSKLIASNLITTGAIEFDGRGEATWVNKAICELFGMSYDQMLGKGWLSAVQDEKRLEVWEDWVTNIEYGIPYEGDFTIHNKQTLEDFTVRLTVVSHKSVDGNILAYYGTVTRIS